MLKIGKNLVLFFLGVSFPFLAWAQTEEVPAEFLQTFQAQLEKSKDASGIPIDLQKMVETADVPEEEKRIVETIADIRIRNAEISEIKKNHLKISFDVENAMETRSGMVYGLELIKKYSNQAEVLMDVKIFSSDPLTVEKNGKIRREIQYQSPEFLSGDYVLWLKIKDESGLPLALQPFQVNFSGQEGYWEQANPCYLTIEGENDKKYKLSEGVSLKQEEKLFLNCQTKNFFEESLLAVPYFEFYRRDLYGLKVDKKGATFGEETAMAAGEEKLMKTEIPLPVEPQAYDVKVFFQKEQKTISNPVIAHFVVVGKSATISQLTLDKDDYRTGEVAKLGVLWSGPADGFLGSRIGGSGLTNPVFEIEMKNREGKDYCLPKQIKKPSDFDKIIELKMDKDCSFPMVVVRILDEGRLLYEKTLNTLPESLVEKQVGLKTKNNSFFDKNLGWMVGVLLGIILLVSSILFFHQKNKNRKSPLIFLLFVSGVLMFSDQAGAATDRLYGTPFIQDWYSSELTGTNWTYLSTCGVSLSGVPRCPRPPLPNICYFSSKSVWYYGSVYGCYQDVVDFAYNLSSTAVNQGSTITASGSATGVNVCNNGVTTNMLVVPRYGVSSAYQQILNNVWFNDSGVNHSGSTSFSTTGWPCGTYRALFSYMFNHMDSHYGNGSIYYSVNNCCTQTCSTGPGCRSSLTNGSVVGGTCCGGTSCYNCNAGYYWNGSMCTAYTCGGFVPANASAYDIEESSVPVPASISWTYSGSDTATKCQYRCNSGYLWNGSACVAPSNNSACVSVSGVPSSIVAGGTFSAQVRMRNTGTKVWNSDVTPHRLGSANSYDNTTWGLNRVGLPVASVSQNGEVTFTVNAKAPATPGSYPFSWRMVEDAVEWFGPICSSASNVTVNPAPVNGACGTANGKIFPSTATGWSPYTTCAAGTASPVFPAIGTTRTWTCLGQNGGANSPLCGASRVAAPTLTFSAAPNPVAYNNASTLSWTTTGATSCWASNAWTGWKNNLGGTESTGLLTLPKTYVLECWNNANAPASQTTGQKSVAVGLSYSCGSSIPGNAEAYDAEENTGLVGPANWAYSASDTATKCQYKCNSGYNYIGGFCELPQPGECGDADGRASCGKPDSDLCNIGTPTAVTQNNPNTWNWTCAGLFGGSSVDCSARKECSWYETNS